MKEDYNENTEITGQEGPGTIIGTAGTDKLQIPVSSLIPFLLITFGLAWGIWHMPAFLLSGTQQSEWSFVPFLIGCIALSIIVTPLFNRSNGSILLAAFFHFMLMNPIFPDAQPYDTWIIIVIAVIVVLTNRKTMFIKKGAVTTIIPLR